MPSEADKFTGTDRDYAQAIAHLRYRLIADNLRDTAGQDSARQARRLRCRRRQESETIFVRQVGRDAAGGLPHIGGSIGVMRKVTRQPDAADSQRPAWRQIVCRAWPT